MYAQDCKKRERVLLELSYEETKMLAALVGKVSAVAATTPLGAFMDELYLTTVHVAEQHGSNPYEEQFGVQALGEVDEFAILVKSSDGEFR
ncbi:hypothetical protein Epa17_00123 [Pseudomonas phage Epa17]|uniref:Uncharacterized protein n=4 Tax=Nankokuvirus G1 TaxID=2560662 RepID=A0A6G9LF79_9CAUD|nr:hypothetical protein Epa24_00034 [Pseudomonas phage Epa24]QIQ64168.1 hypothetical protein Epa17_00123 [Pseudomonas phage Epa17]QIQ65060.1 hypothetical protein 16_00042 [Pseudomonas phage Epa16]QIQ65695.1 hypothetical protein 26_00137 [Pseudomonas phage Epa26]